MYLKLIFIAVFIIFPLCVVVWLTYRRFRKQEATKQLFEEKLVPLCYNAMTLEQVNEAWNIIFDECIDKNDRFKIDLSYKNDFHGLRFLLLGKLQILKDDSAI